MRIALVTYGLKMGGVETFLGRFSRFLTEQGHHVDLIPVEEPGEAAASFAASGHNVAPVLPRRWCSRLDHVRRVARALQGYDVVILNDAPFAQSILGLLPEQTISFAIIHLDMPSFYRNAVGSRGQWDAVVAVSPRISETLRREHHVSDARIQEIPYGVEVAEQYPRRDEMRVPAAALRVAFVGRIENRQKGVLRLPEIFSRLERTAAGNITLDIFGDGPDVQALQAAFRARGLRTSIEFHGWLENRELRTALLRRDVLILPSNTEGWPIIVLEAMAMGVVPVTSRLAGITDRQIDDGRTGILVEPADVAGFAAAIVRLARDRETLRQMSLAAWTEARQFTVDAMGHQYLDLIRELERSSSQGRDVARSGRIDDSLLGDLPYLPLCLVRVTRKVLRTMRVWPSPLAPASQLES